MNDGFPHLPTRSLDFEGASNPTEMPSSSGVRWTRKGGAVTPTSNEDSSNFLLVESLWELRRKSISALDLTEGDSSPYARRNRPFGGGGVEAHGSSATLSS